MNSKKKLLLGIIFFGSIWGGLEVLGIEIMRITDFGLRAPILALIGMIVLMTARVIFPKPGSTALIGLVAAGFKFLGLSNILFCQIAAVIGQAIIFDLGFSFLEKREWLSKKLLLGTSGIILSYINFTVFSFSQAYIFMNSWWTNRGPMGLLEWIFTDGTYAAVFSFFGIIISANLGKSLAPTFEQWQTLKTRAYNTVAVAAALSFWVLGFVLYH